MAISDEIEQREVRVELDRVTNASGEDHAVVVRIHDNGTGMDEATRQRIFDPFYTTKEVGKGTGLGLSIVKGILDDHRANVVVESTLGEGTSFSLTFPLDHRPESESP